MIGLILGGTVREHEALMERNMVSNDTDMQDKYCGDFYDIHPIQSQYNGRHLCILALNKVTIVAVTTILVLHVGNPRSEHA